MHGEMKICGLDSESIGDAEVDLQNELVVKHMRGLQRKFWGKRVRYISLVEGNMSWVVANQICQVMDAFQPIMHGCKDESKKVVGVSTTEQVKENMVNTARSLMHQRKLCVHRDVVCEGRRRGLEHDAKCASVIGVLGEQLKRLQMRTKPGKDIFSKTKSKISGKVGAHNDDLAIACLFTIHWACAHTHANRLPLKRL